MAAIKQHGPLLLCLVLLVGGGIVNGVQTNRWTEDGRIAEAAARMDKLPTKFGGWIGTPREIPQRQLDATGASRHYSYRFKMSEGGPVVDVVILCGKRGQMAVHQPTLCFTGAGWKPEEEPKSGPLSADQPAEFWSAHFVRKVDSVDHHLQTSWSWAHGSGWQAPDNPRLAFAGQPYLYKLYLSVQFNRAEATEIAEQTLEAFASEFLPAVNEALELSQ